MKRIALLTVIAVAPFLMAAMGMDEQPSYRAYEAPLLAPPADSVPVTGRETITRSDEPRNPVTAAESTLSRGKELFEINCVMCHGRTSDKRGPVGLKLNPPPPGLNKAMVQRLSDAAIYKAMTFGFGRMPSFRERLQPRERWLVVTYLRTRN